MLKTCCTCKIAKPATPEFYSKDKSRLDGLANKCRQCNAAKSREYYRANIEKQIERSKKNKLIHGWGAASKDRKPRQPIPELPETPSVRDPLTTYELVQFRECEWLACIQAAQKLGLRDAKSFVRQSALYAAIAAGIEITSEASENK